MREWKEISIKKEANRLEGEGKEENEEGKREKE